MRRTILAAAPLAVLALVPAAAAQERVGEVVLATGQVTSTLRAAPPVRLTPGDDVFLDARIRTGRRSQAKMTLDPRGVAHLGESMELVLSRSRVDDLTGEGGWSLSLLLGRLRLALSPEAETDVTVDTPTSTIGVKGTDVRFLVRPDGSTVVAVWEGEVTVTAKAGGRPVVVRGRQATVVGPGREPTPPAFLAPEGGPPSPPETGGDDDPGDHLTDPPLPPDLGDFPIDRGAGANREEAGPR